MRIRRFYALLAAAFILGILAARSVTHAAQSANPGGQHHPPMAAAQATVTPTAVAPLPYAPLIHLPVLGALDAKTLCQTQIRVQNVGHEPSKSMIVTWGTPGACPPQGAGPLKVECSGLLRPGSTWNFLGAQIPPGSQSGLIVSFSARRFEELGIDMGFSDIVADFLCETLFFGVVGDVDDFRRFQRAYEAGEVFAGLPLNRAYGSPLAVEVMQDCTGPSLGHVVGGMPAVPDEIPTKDAGNGPFEYAAPAVYGNGSGRESTLKIQNAGTMCADFEIWIRSPMDVGTGQCDAPILCMKASVAPGERRDVSLKACQGETRSVVALSVVSAGPLAVSVATVSTQAGAISGYTALSPLRSGNLAVSAIAPRLMREANGWSSVLHIQGGRNAAQNNVSITFFDDAGKAVATLPIASTCSDSGWHVDLRQVRDLPNGWQGSARVELKVPTFAIARTSPPRLSVVAELVKQTSANALLADTFYDAVAGLDGSGPPTGQSSVQQNAVATNGAAMVAVPFLSKGGIPGQDVSELAIVNAVSLPGRTDFATFIFDQNGLVDTTCHKLPSGDVEYLDLAKLGFLPPMFTGSAVISAIYWDHLDRQPSNPQGSPIVGLGAVRFDRPLVPRAESDAPLTIFQAPAAFRGVEFAPGSGADVFIAWRGPHCPINRTTPTPTFEVPIPTTALLPTATPTASSPSPTPQQPHRIHLPLVAAHAEAFDPAQTALPPTETPTETPSVTPSSTPTKRPTNTPYPTSTPTAFGGSHEVGPYQGPSELTFLPILQSFRGAECQNSLSAMNLGSSPTVFALVLWSNNSILCPPRDSGPLGATCSGEVKPGASWNFPAQAVGSLDREMWKGAKSGAFFSVSPSVAGKLCRELHPGLSGKSNQYVAFREAWDSGGIWRSVSLKGAAAGPATVTVERTCPGNVVPGVPVTGGYQGIPSTELGAFDDAMLGFTYHVPLLYADKGGAAAGVGSFNSLINIQNAGLGCNSVEVWFKGQDDCLRSKVCAVIKLAPGETEVLDASDCVGPVWQGSAWIRSTEPLAITVDIVGRDTLSTYEGEPYHVVDARGVTKTLGSNVLYAPLAYSEYQGWDTSVQVENRSSEVNAKVKVSFLDRGGDVITSLVDWICPRGSQTFFLPVVHNMPGYWVGSIRVESQDWSNSGDPPSKLPYLSGVATLVKYNDSARTETREAGFYNLLTEQEGFTWPDGSGAGGLDSGVGLIALPQVVKGAAAQDDRTEIAVTNLVKTEGYTDFSVALFDASGLIDDACFHLAAKQTAYLDLDQWGFVKPGLAVSAVISATRWVHPLVDPRDGSTLRNLVGLGAVAVQRHHARLGLDEPGDEMSATTGVPLRGDVGKSFARILSGVTACPGATGAPEPAAPELAVSPASARLVHLPVVGGVVGVAPCTSTIGVQNVGSGPTQVVLVLHDERSDCGAGCSPPARVACSGLLKPGVAWTFVQLGAMAASGTLFSFSAEAADQGCRMVSGLSSCAAFAAFVDAFRSGGLVEGLKLGDAYGGPIAAQVHLACGQEPMLTASLNGTNDALLGVLDPTIGQYRYALPLVATDGASPQIELYNAGTACARAQVWIDTPGECSGPRMCGEISVAPGHRKSDRMQTCRWPGGMSPPLAWMTSSQPLVVASGAMSPEGWMLVGGQPHDLASSDGRPVLGGSTVLYGPLTMNEYQGWVNTVHLANLDPAEQAKAKVVFMDRSGDIVASFIEWVCPLGARDIRLPALSDLPGSWVGSVRVESLAYALRAGGTVVKPARLAGALSMINRSGAGPNAPLQQAAAYSLLGERQGFDWELGAGAGGTDSGAGIIAIPSLMKDLDGSGVTSELAIANLVPQPGRTDFVIFIFDQNGLKTQVCQRLKQQQVEYIDLQTRGYVDSGFKGSAIISAVDWTHQVVPEAGGGERRAVGLGAVVVNRRGARLGEELAGDEMGAEVGLPLSAAEASALMPAIIAERPVCPAEPSPTPTTAAP